MASAKRDHIFSLSSIIKNRLAEQKPTYCAFIDLEKAFDWVHRDLLLLKLLRHNIDGKMYKSVKNLLGKTQSCIELNTCLRSEWFSINSGVRQGDCLSPTLFSLYINDLVEYLKINSPVMNVGNLQLNILLYADDMVVLGETEEALQSLLHKIYEWCNDWRLKVNESKTKIVHFRNASSDVTEFKFMYGQSELEKVSQYKYLGIILDEYLKYNCCIKALADSSGRALGGIISKFKSLRNVGYDTFSKLYKSGVQPVSEYGAGIWGWHKASEIDTIQNRAMRYYLGVHKFAANAAIVADMGWTKPMYNRYLCLIRFWNRMLSLPDERLTKQIFNYDYDKCVRNWCKEIKCIFDKLDLQHIYTNKETCDLSIVQGKIKELMKSSWQQEVQNKPKLRSFILFKDDVNVEPYVQFIHDRQTRSLLAQLRCGILPLKIETGRFSRLPVEERLCELCNNEQVESEIHFICYCPLYDDVRTNMYNQVKLICHDFETMTTENKFVYLMKYRWRDVSKYISQAWNIRKAKLYQ